MRWYSFGLFLGYAREVQVPGRICNEREMHSRDRLDTRMRHEPGIVLLTCVVDAGGWEDDVAE